MIIAVTEGLPEDAAEINTSIVKVTEFGRELEFPPASLETRAM